MSIQSLPRFGTELPARTETVLYPSSSKHKPPHLNTFRGEPASSTFDWHFTANHKSSADFSTSVGSSLHLVLPKFHSAHG
jgi:hypothetical protein